MNAACIMFHVNKSYKEFIHIFFIFFHSFLKHLPLHISTRTTFSHQPGFKVSCSAKVTDEPHTAREASLFSIIILQELSAVFDAMNHQILLSTLWELGVSGSALSLFTSYLKGST